MNRKTFISIAVACMGSLLTGCNDSMADTAEKNVIDLISYPTPTAEDSIDAAAFACINLDYPGLEKVKSQYEQKQYFNAACELLNYYRSRTNVQNPYIDLLAPTISSSDQNIADQALQHRFYIRNFKESTANGMDVYYSFDNNGKIDWETLAGTMSDQEFKNQLHRHQWMPALAKAYRISNDEKYFLEWKKTYTDWMKQYPIPTGLVDSKNVAWFNLQPTERVRDRMNIIPSFIQSTNFTPGWLMTVLTALNDELEIIRKGYDTEGSNIRLSQAKVVTSAGIFFPELKNANAWLEEGVTDINRELGNQFNKDGVHNELDPSYHIGAISDFYEIYRLAKLNNRTDKLPGDYFSKLKNATYFVADILFPDYSIDNYNDTRNSSYTKSVVLKNLRKYAEIFPDDQQMLWMSSERQRGTQPEYLMKKYESSGYYMLRNGWDMNSTMMVVKNNFNPDAKWHCQPDNGTFGLYHKGRNFFPDAGAYSYGGTRESNRTREEFRATKNHNTLTLEGKTIDRNHTNGKLLAMYQDGQNQILVTENKSYDEITHRRAVIFVEQKFFVIIDEAYGNAAGKDINLHFHLQNNNERTAVVIDNGFANNAFGAHTEYGDNNNVLLYTSAETLDGLKAEVIESVISNTLAQTNGYRKGYTYTIKQPAKGAARFISVVYPIDNYQDIKTIEARFTDNEPGQEGTFHDKSAKILVTINGKKYPLTYKL